ncbi:hypothetical protein WUBG_14762 [Wuchereria bancrofti]|uniref:Uncharacterized protein n=1 Tax=Wuchereria bancrofti TaxID=6293 RepID=J9DX85_WUCBA|nr:hypothetical protein WUBG_14762 [Wuchereria bancrofti]
MVHYTICSVFISVHLPCVSRIVVGTYWQNRNLIKAGLKAGEKVEEETGSN